MGSFKAAKNEIKLTNFGILKKLLALKKSPRIINGDGKD